ncbi:MAG: cytidine deaminase [Chloroflexales bacterium]|nr:cytidine deaminase [Chloroflexales bacterium]
MNTTLDQDLVDAAIALANKRYPSGECIVAALRTHTGRILTSVYSEARVDSACLCAETGSICEAHKLGEIVTASVCLYRASESEPLRILPACGVCQERLAYWGLAVPAPSNSGRLWQAKTLRELRPFYWDDDAC